MFGSSELPCCYFSTYELKTYRATSGERNVIERIKAPTFLQALLAIAQIQFRRESQPLPLKR